MDLRNHLNLINNHGYDGWIAIYKGRDLMGIKNGEIVVVKNQPHYEPDHNRCTADCDWLNNHRTMEVPYSQENIEENLRKGSLIKTINTTVGTPLSQLEQIYV